MPAHALLLLLALGQAPPPAGPAGTWVPAELRRALAAGRPMPLPCFLSIEADRSARETCPEGIREWGTGQPSDRRPNALTLEFPGGREVVHRGGTPGELEVIEAGAGGESFRRLYRLSPQLGVGLASWGVAQRLLAGTYRTAEGTPATFTPDGRYRLASEQGTYRVELEPEVPGSQGMLVLAPEGEAERRYFLVPQGARTGLAPVPPDFPPPAPERADLPAWAPVGSEGAAVDLGMPPPPPPADGAPPAPEAEPPAWSGPLPPVVIALTPERPQEAQPPSPSPPPAPAAPPPIAQPIAPRSRCGCAAPDAAVSATSLALLALCVRRKHHRRG